MTLSTSAVITVAEFKTFFDRDFTFGSAIENVRDSDIERAINTGVPLFNPGLFDDIATRKLAASYQAAHLLVIAVKAAGGLKKKGKGINSTGSFPIANKSAGPLSVGYAIPQDVIENPVLFQFTKTEYGMMYLQLVTPYLIGNIGIAGGDTQP